MFPYQMTQRQGKPDFVQFKILKAFHRIGSKLALETAKDLTNQHKQNKKYWANLQNRKANGLY